MRRVLLCIIGTDFKGGWWFGANYKSNFMESTGTELVPDESGGWWKLANRVQLSFVEDPENGE